MARLPFEANYYELLELAPSVQPRPGAREIEDALEALKTKNATGAKGQELVRIKLGQALLATMREHLLEDGAPVWVQHRDGRRKALKQQVKSDNSRIAKVLRILGEGALPETARKNLSKDFHDDAALDSALRKAKITIFSGEKADEVPRPLFNSIRRAEPVRKKMTPLLLIENVKDVWEFLSRITGTKIGPKSTAEDVANVADVLIQKKQADKLTENERGAYALIQDSVDKMLRSHKSDGPSDLTILNQLWLIERDLGLDYLLAIFSRSERVARAQFDRVVADVARILKVDQAYAQLLMRGWLEVWEIPQPRFVDTRAVLLSACPFCGELNPADAKNCASCGQSPLIGCANCGTRLNAQIGTCPSCGVSVVQAAEAQKELQQSRLLIAQGKTDEAEAALRSVAGTLTKVDLSKELGEIQRIKREAQSTLGRLVELTSSLRMEEASQVLAGAGASLSKDELSRIASLIAEARTAATTQVTRAERHMESKAYREATRAAEAALERVADHAQAREILDIIPPAQVRDLSGVVRDGAVHLKWAAPLGGARDVAYEVRRHAGKDMQSGSLIDTVNGLSFSDRDCPDGVQLTYSITAIRPKARADEIARFGPIVVYRPIRKLQISPILGEVHLEWVLPEGATYAEVRRFGPDGPDRPLSQIRPLAKNKTTWVDRDETVQGERTYSIQAFYDKGGQTGRGPEVKRSVTPEVAPTKLGPFQQRRDKTSVTWAGDGERGEVDAIHAYSPNVQLPAANTVLQLSDLPDPVSRITSISTRKGQSSVPLSSFPAGRHAALVVRKRGGLVRTSGKLSVDYVPPLGRVKNLRVRIVDWHVVVEWSWPQNATRARISFVVEVHGSSGDGRGLNDVTVEAVSGKSGRYKLPRMLGHSCDLTVSVVPEATGGASGPAAEARTRFVLPLRISAALRRESRLAGMLKTLHLDLKLEKKAKQWPAMNVVFRAGSTKTGLKKPEVIQRIKATKADAHQLSLDLSRELRGKSGLVSVEPDGASAKEFRVTPRHLKFEQ